MDGQKQKRGAAMNRNLPVYDDRRDDRGAVCVVLVCLKGLLSFNTVMNLSGRRLQRVGRDRNE